MAKKTVYGTAALVGLAMLAYSAVWWIAADRFRGELDGWAADLRGRGWTVSYGRVRIEGYPASLTAVVEAPSIGADGWRWRGPRVAATARPWNPGRIALDGAGVHRVRAGGAEADPVRIAAGSASGLILRRSGARAARIVLNLEDVAIDAPGLALPRRLGAAEAAVDLPERPGRADRGRGPQPPGPAIAARLRNIEFHRGESAAPGPTIEEISLTAELTGPLPRDATAKSLAVWRDGGGTVEIGGFSLRWRKARGEGSGTFALDRDLQPLAALTVRIEGYADLVRLSAAMGWVKARDTDAIRLGLDLLAHSGAGQPGAVALPLTVQNRRLYLGPIQVMRLPRIAWDG